MTREELQGLFPKLADSGYAIASPMTPAYNCIAFAVGDETQWWEHGARLCYWPPSIQRGDNLDSWIHVFELHGYSRTDDESLEQEFEKVAIYVDLDMLPTHVAKQLPDGRWKSKLGKGHDIEHDTLDVLEGDQMDEYGIVAQCLKRKISLKASQRGTA
jgi:hypothetical protein